jgi:Preprotein translocase subunit SecB
MESGSSSIISQMQFLGFKIDVLDLKLKPYIDLLAKEDFKNGWAFETHFRIPSHSKTKNLYLGGLLLKLTNTQNIKSVSTGEIENVEVLSLNAGITGTFQFESQIDQKQEKLLVERQIPTILFPFLRAAITNILASAGYGSFVIPLMNVAEMAKQTNLVIEDMDLLQKKIP